MLHSFLSTFPWLAKLAPLFGVAKSPKGRVAAKLLVFNYLQAGVSFFVSMWLAKKLGEEGYGIVGYGFTLAAICHALVDFGGERTLVRDLTHTEDANKTMTASVVMRLFIATIVGLVGALWIFFGSTARGHILPLTLFSFSGIMFGLSPKGWYDFKYRMSAHAGILLVEKVLYSVFTVVLVLSLAGPSGVLIVAVCLFGTRLVSLMAQWWQTLKTFSPTTQNLSSDLSWILSQNVFVAAAMLGNLMAPHVNGLLLGYQKGEAAMAHFFLAVQVLAMVQIVQQAAARMLVPRIAEVTSPGTPNAIIRSRFIRFSLYSLTITLLLVIPLILSAGWLIGLFLPEGFQASVLPLRLLLLSSLAHSIGLIVNHFLICLRCNAHYFATSIGKGGIAILLGWLLIPGYGAFGVALTILICATLTMTVQCGLAWKAISQRDPSPHNE